MDQTIQELNTEMVNICITKACNLNNEDAMDRGRWKKLIKIG